MDKKGWIIIILCALGLVGNQWYSAKKADEWRKTTGNPRGQPAAGSRARKPGTKTAAAGGQPRRPPPASSRTCRSPRHIKEEETVIEAAGKNTKDRVRYVFTNRGGGIKRVEFPGDPIHANTQEPVVLNAKLDRAIGAVSDGVDRVETGEYKMTARTDSSLTYEGMTYNGLLARKIYTIKPAPEGGLPTV